MKEEKKPFWVHCKTCAYEWIAFFTPIPVTIMKKFNIKNCPRCHKITVYAGKPTETLKEIFSEKLG